MSACYEGQQFVGIDLHRRRTVLVRMTSAGERLGGMVRFPSTPEALRREMVPALSPAGPAPQVVLEATYGWYWAVETLQQPGARVHLAHPLGIKGFTTRRVKNDLLTELPDRSFERCARRSAVLARFRPRDQRRGRAAGVLRVGGAAARLA